jgi:hypothetical protein
MPDSLPSLLSSAHRLLDPNAPRDERDVERVARFAAQAKDAPVVGARVYYHCDKAGRDLVHEYNDGSSRDLVAQACAFIDRLSARECCTFTRVVHVLAVDVEVSAEAAEAGKDGG